MKLGLLKSGLIDDLLTGRVRVLEVDLQSLQATFSNVPRRTLQRDLQQAVVKDVLLAAGATH